MQFSVESPVGVLASLFGIAAFFFYLQQKTGAKLFDYFPPLIFIYGTPVILSYNGVLPHESPVYDALKSIGLPVMICLMLLSVDVAGAVRVMGKGMLVMLMGTLGIVVGGVVSYFLFHGKLSDDAWTGFAALAGSWIGGTGNMAAAADAVETPPGQMGLAVLADNLVYIVWLPIMLGSRAFADRFNRWARVPADRLARMEAAAAQEVGDERVPAMRDYLYLGILALGVAWLSSYLSREVLPELPRRTEEVQPIVSASVWNILCVTTFSIALSFTRASKLPGTHNVAMAIVYVYVASMGAKASLEALSEAKWFVAAAFVWIAVHGLFCLAGAKIFRVDVHSVAIASAANVGGAASAPVVAAAHRESLVPASILMALVGYALGNYLAILTGQWCRMIAGG